MNYFFSFIENFDKLHMDDLTPENVFEYFWDSKRRILFIVDDTDTLLGIITLGNFIKHHDDIWRAINKNYLFIEKAPLERMFSRAKEIYYAYQIESDIPVVDGNRHILGYITDTAAYARLVKEAEQKISRYQKSHYLRKEIAAFYKVLAGTKIYAKQCEAFQIISSPLANFPVTLLSEADYTHKIQTLLQKRETLTDEEKMEIILDFELENKDELYDKLGIHAVYSLKKFMREFTELVENEEFSRLIRLSEENAPYGLKDFIEDNHMENITFSSNKLLTKCVYDYMRKNRIPFSLSDDNSISMLHASFQKNGLRSNFSEGINLSSCDLGQLYLLKQKLQGRQVHTFYIQNAVNARLTQTEASRLTHHRTREAILADKDNVELERLYKDDCRDQTPLEYAQEIFRDHYPIKRRFENDMVLNTDYNSLYFNVENGVRRTCFQPNEYTNTIYVLGPCIALSPYVEDSHTIPSLLSKRLMHDNYSYRIVNLGLLSSGNSLELPNNISLEGGDIIISFIFTEKIKNIGKILDGIIDPSDAFNAIPDRDDMFWETSVHCNRKGNEVYADVIYRHIKPVLQRNARTPKKNNVYNIFKTNFTDLHLYGIPEYLDMLHSEKRKLPKIAQVIGSIVMNGNPYTLGHKYLVEYALQNCDYLFIFVVQEDKSYFSFDDRLAIVTENCRQYPNVCVLPSGKMIASNITFPEYFKREVTRDSASNADITITPVLDFRLYATYIAPALGITKRFVAEEPLDPVTKQYNENMKKVLSSFGIDVVEIQRKTLADGKVISASEVRKAYKSRDFEKMKELLPAPTYLYLVKKLEA